MNVLVVFIGGLIIVALNLAFAYGLGMFASWLTGVEMIQGVKIEHWFVIASILFAMMRGGVSKA